MNSTRRPRNYVCRDSCYVSGRFIHEPMSRSEWAYSLPDHRSKGLRTARIFRYSDRSYVSAQEYVQAFGWS